MKRRPARSARCSVRTPRTSSGGHGDTVVSADDITSITSSAIRTALTRAELAALPPYVEEASFHVGSVGRFRKHTGWKQDSESDEEMGVVLMARLGTAGVNFQDGITDHDGIARVE